MAGRLITDENMLKGEGAVSITDELASSGYTHLKFNKDLPVGEQTLISQVTSIQNTSGNSYPSIDESLYLLSGHPFQILEEGLGHNCRWDKINIKIGEQTLTGYVHNGLVDKNSMPFNCTKPTIASLAQSKDWTKQEPNKVYYNQAMLKWCVPIETIHDSTGGDDFLSFRMNETREKAIKLILLELGKSASIDILGYAHIIKAEEWYLDPRPNTKLRVLATIEDKYTSALPDIDLTYQQADKVISLDATTYMDTTKDVSEIMQMYAGEIDLFEGTIENLDLRREAKRLEMIPSKLTRLLHSNGIDLKDGTTIEIGLNTVGTCEYIAENSQGAYKNVTKGVSSLRDSEPFDSERTMNYLYMLQEMSEARQDGSTWTSFVSRFTISPDPTIFPSLPKGSSPLDISDATRNQNGSSMENSSITKLDRESRDIYKSFGMSGGGSLLDGGACSGSNYKLNLWNKKTRDKMIEDMDKVYKAAASSDILAAEFGLGDGSLFKTVEDAAKKELEYAKGEMVDTIIKEAEKAVDEIGDKVMGNLNTILKSVHGLDDIFKEILNKICLGDLAIPALACLEVPALSDEFKQVLSDLPDLDLCKSGNQICIPTISLPTFKTTDLMGEMSKAILNSLLDVLTKVFVEMIKSIIESLLSICGEEDDENAIQPTDIPNMPNILGGVDLPNLVSDIADLLSPKEFCRLLSGEASPKTLSLIRSLIKNRYPSLSQKFQTKTSIIDLFFGLGAMVDSEMCHQLAKLPEGPATLNCSNPYQIDDKLLARLAADDDLTDDQLEEQLNNARERKRVKYEKFAEIIKIITGESGKSFEEIAMSMIQNSEGSVININNDSINYMHENLLRVMFNGIEKSFDIASQALLDAFVELTFQKVKTPYWTVLENGVKIRSFAASKLITQGVSEETLEQYSDENSGMILVDSEAQKTNKRIRHLLQDMESNNVFKLTTAEDGTGINYELTIPPDPEIIETIRRLVLSGTLTTEQQDDFDRLFEASMWKVRYKMPFGENSYTTTDDGHYHTYSVSPVGDGYTEYHYDRAGVEEPHRHKITNWLVEEGDNHFHKVSQRRMYDKFGIEVFPSDNPSSYRAIKTTTTERISDELRDYVLENLPDDIDIPLVETAVDTSSPIRFDQVPTSTDFLSEGNIRTSTGVMFDIFNSSQDTIRIGGEFSSLLSGYGEEADITVWYADRTHRGIETVMSGWTLLGTANDVTPIAPLDSKFPTSFTVKVEGEVPFFDIPPAQEFNFNMDNPTIPAPTTYSIYITTNSESMQLGVRGFRTSTSPDPNTSPSLRELATSNDGRVTILSGTSQGIPNSTTNLFSGDGIGTIDYDNPVGLNGEASFLGTIGYGAVIEDPTALGMSDECDSIVGTINVRYLPPQHDIFGSYVVKQWEDQIDKFRYVRRNLEDNITFNFGNPSLDVEEAERQFPDIPDDILFDEESDDNFQTFKKDLYSYFAKVVYPQASRDLLAMIGQQIASSPLLNDDLITKTIEGVDMSIISSKMQKLSLNRRPTKAEIACDIDTHLLRVDSHKQEIRKNIREKNCFSKDAFIENPDGTSRTELTSWETTVLETVIKMTIRSYMIDYAIRGIFPLTKFSLDQSVDNYLIEFLTRKMIADMTQFGFAEYAVPFVETANVVYSDMLMNGRIVPEETSASDTNVGVRAITKQILPEVYKDLTCIIEKDFDLINLDLSISSSSIYNKMLNEWLPVLDLPKEEDITRYTNLGDDLEGLAEQLQRYIVDYPALKKHVEELREERQKLQREFDEKNKAWSDAYKILNIKINGPGGIKERELELVNKLTVDGCLDGASNLDILGATIWEGLAEWATFGANESAGENRSRLQRCKSNFVALVKLIGGQPTWTESHYGGIDEFLPDFMGFDGEVWISAGAGNENYAGRWDPDNNLRTHEYGVYQHEFYEGFTQPKEDARFMLDDVDDRLSAAVDALHSFTIGDTAASEFNIEDVVDVFYTAQGEIAAIKQDLSTTSFLPTLSSGENGVSLDLQNGNFFLERFWKINRKSMDEIREILESLAGQFPDEDMPSILDNFNFAWNSAFESINIDPATSQEEAIDILTAAGGYAGDRYYNIEEFNEKFKTFMNEFAALQNSSIESMMTARTLQREIDDLQRQIDEWNQWYDYWTDPVEDDRVWPNVEHDDVESILHRYGLPLWFDEHRDIFPLTRDLEDLRDNGWGMEWILDPPPSVEVPQDGTGPRPWEPWKYTPFYFDPDSSGFQRNIEENGTFAKGLFNPPDDPPGLLYMKQEDLPSSWQADISMVAPLIHGIRFQPFWGFGSIPYNIYGIDHLTKLIDKKTREINLLKTQTPEEFDEAIYRHAEKIVQWGLWYKAVKETVDNRNKNTELDVRHFLDDPDRIVGTPNPPSPHSHLPYVGLWDADEIEPFIVETTFESTRQSEYTPPSGTPEEHYDYPDTITETREFTSYTMPHALDVADHGIEKMPQQFFRDDPTAIIRARDEFAKIPYDMNGVEDYKIDISELEGRKEQLIIDLAILAAGTVTSLNNFFDELTPGLRIVYTPPVRDSQYIDDEGVFDEFEGAPQNRIDEIVDALAPENEDILDYIQNHLKNRIKAFYFKERITRGAFDVTPDVDNWSPDDPNTGDGIPDWMQDASGISKRLTEDRISSKDYFREVYPIPLVDSTGIELMDAACLASSDVGPSWWSDNQNINMFNLAGNGDWVEEFNFVAPNIQKRISNSKEFNLLFDFVFPIDRYLSMLNVYSVLVSSSLEGMETAMSGPRQKMFKLFEMLRSAGNYQSPTPSPYNLEDVSGDGETKCFQLDDKPISLEKLLTGDFAINANMPKNPFDVDWGAVTKVAKDNIKALFKALVEFQDPNIKAAKKIRTLLANLGMCPVPPMLAISLGLLPPTVFGYPPLGIGIGPPLTPIGMAYLLFGFEMGTLYDYFYTDKAIEEEKLVDCAAVEDRTCGKPPEPIE